MTRTPETYREYENLSRDSELVAEMAKIRLMEQMASDMANQAQRLETISKNLQAIAYRMSDGNEYYTE